MASVASSEVCLRRWCNEAGKHNIHRHYLGSIPVEAGWMLGVNAAKRRTLPRAVEFALMPRRGGSHIVPLTPREADLLAKAFWVAVGFAARPYGQARREREQP